MISDSDVAMVALVVQKVGVANWQWCMVVVVVLEVQRNGRSEGTREEVKNIFRHFWLVYVDHIKFIYLFLVRGCSEFFESQLFFLSIYIFGFYIH